MRVQVTAAPKRLVSSGGRPGKARTRPTGEPTAVTLQAGGLVEVEHDDDLFGKHRCLDLAPQPAERERCDRRSQLGMPADIATLLGWKMLGLERSLGSRIVTYADGSSKVTATSNRPSLPMTPLARTAASAESRATRA